MSFLCVRYAFRGVDIVSSIYRIGYGNGESDLMEKINLVNVRWR